MTKKAIQKPYPGALGWLQKNKNPLIHLKVHQRVSASLALDCTDAHESVFEFCR